MLTNEAPGAVMQAAKPRRLAPATDETLAFARELTRVNMRDYYSHYGLVWQPEAFDTEWPNRESYVVEQAGKAIGFLSLTLESDYLYIRDIQLIEAYRGEGVGQWVMVWVLQLARARGCARVRLKVFKNNPASGLYLRLGYRHVGEEPALYWMEYVLEA
ncbi:GNAT family N-acetyltransferase [Pseudomonas sp. SLFW]|uniref:GNAT family N-acetyltransferase n=1 Tax=Pseudomonas sp. SLFW TaxID=2683259 RepID=UPI001413431A|nr:GNAT family N-acetyltransferase [Pseudomonas sp. SLFW]NBB09579.1 GNAT family N-acetyltransferase [Pseudomonas sp. SLFW]